MDCEFQRDELVRDSNWVVDIGDASAALRKVLSKYNYKNLDELPQFSGVNTTTEFMCRVVFDDMVAEFADQFDGALKVTIAESHTAWASYSGKL